MAVVLVAFLLTAEVRTPLVRAAVTAAVAVGAMASGRKWSAVEVLAAAAALVLFWRPSELGEPGFQLSFLAVGAILLLSRRVSERLWPVAPWDRREPTGLRWAGRLAFETAVVSLVAFSASAPLVAHHFGLVAPWAVPLSVVIAIPLGVLLGLGYAKAVLGAGLAEHRGGVGGAAAGGDGCVRVDRGGSVDLAGRGDRCVAPAELGLGGGCDGGGLPFGWPAGCGKDGVTAVLCAALLGGWWYAGPIGRGSEPESRFAQHDRAEAWSWTALSVGDGTCHVVRGGGAVVLVDCGSGAYPALGGRLVAPALRAMGVERIDLAVVTHGDLDHYVGLLDLADVLPIDEVVVGIDVLDQSRTNPEGPEAALLIGLDERGVTVAAASAGWSYAAGQMQLRALWPSELPPDEPAAASSSNERSLVVRIEAHGRSLLLSGDIEAYAMRRLVDGGAALPADAASIPHHGGYREGASEAYVQAVGASVVGAVVQSTQTA